MLASSFFTGSIDLQSEAKVLEDYEIGQRLGEGAYGSVYAVKYIPSGASFALKIIRKHELFASDSTLGQLAMNHKQGCGGDRAHSPVVDYVERHIVQEATVMQLMEHPHVVKFYKFLNSVEAYYFIMELAEGGELFDLIISKHHFPEDECRQYFQQLLSAIDYCHQNGVVHKDLKAENLLLRRDNHLAVCDFGFSSRVPRETMDDPEITKGTADNSALLQTLHHGAMIGTLHYMSPEAVLSSTLGVDDSAFEGSAVSSRLCSSFAGREDATCSDLLHHSPIAAPSSSDPVFPQSSPLNPAHDHHHVEGKGSHEETLLAHSGGSAYQTVASASTTSEEGGIGGIHHGGPAAAASLLAAVAPKKGTSTISAASLKNAPNNNSTTSTLSSMVKSFLDSTASAVGSKKKAAPTSTHGDGAGEDASTAPPSTSGSRVGRPNAGSTTTAEGRMPMAFPLLPLVPHGGEVGGGISSPAAAVTPTTTWSTTKRRPQVIVDSCQQDLWSAGVILFFMLTGRLPFDGRDDEETQHLIQHGTFDFQADEIARISPEARKLVSSMLALEAADRPSIDEILTNKWFQKNLDLATVFPHRKCWPGSPSTTAPPTMGNKAPPSSPASTTTAGAGTWKSSHSPTTPTTSTATSVGGASSKASPSSAGAPAAGSASTFLDFTNTRRVVTAEEEKVLRKAFRCIDRDHLNEITRDQIRDMLIALHHGEAVECDKVDGLMKFFTGGIAGKERITYDEFRNAWVRRGLALNPIACNNAFQLANIVSLKREEVEDHVVRQLRGAFDRVDVNHTGVIQLGRLRQVFEECNIPVQDAEVISLMQYFADNEQLVHALRGTNKQPPSAHSSPVKRSVPEFGAVVMQPKSPESLGLTFDAFLVGILEREVLLRHPMGRKLAAATNLATLFNARNVMECVRHGFLVVGLLRPVRDKLCSVPQRLRLLYTADGGGTTVAKVYSFRYLGESALQAGLTLNGTTTTASQPTTTTPGNHSASPTSPSTTAAPAGSSTWSPQVSASCTARRNTLTGGLVTAGPRVIPTGATPPTTTGSGVGVTTTAKTVVPASTRKCPPPSASGGVPGKEDPLPPSTLPKRATPASTTGAGVVGTVSGSAHRDPGPACVDFSSGSACVVKKPHPRPPCTTAGATTTTTTTPTTANTPPMVKPPCPSGKSAAGTTTTGSAGAVKQRASGEAHHRSINHRSMGFAANGAVAQLNGVCDVDIILSPASLGYTLIQFRRIHGKTSDFHEALQYISVLLEMERQQATEDTMTRGESELM